MNPPRVLIIAGSDSGGGAGIQADIKAVTMFGGHAMTAITAITAQNTLGVAQMMAIPVGLVLSQVDAVLSDIGADAVKLGMIGSAETAQAVADRLEGLDLPIVFDPVMVATSGASLADGPTIAAFDRLMRLSTVTTPNLPELSALTNRNIVDLDTLEDAALDLVRETNKAVLAKGGHLDTPVLTDVLIEPNGQLHRWETVRVETMNTHGTGCTLASAIACGLGQGRELADSVDRARAYVQATIREAPGFGSGHGPIGHTLGTVPWNLIHKNVE
ncbi:MAG TPA: bifunctional hydroxymethylpyrimidine kinase/phosphomethylpyrimidine kinase [Allosphingosinicella sp.]|nr:bifunctional hydroxymethylpyrimidine kinase/phosphomethylpyrimidine kinase [Allosphingosinicella sp.]